MDLPSQIVCKNLSRRSAVTHGMWINPGQDSAWQEAALHCEHLLLFCQDRGTFAFHQSTTNNLRFGAFPKASETPLDWIILSLPRQKALLQMLLDCAASLLSENGTLWLAGENKAGIKSADKWLKTYFYNVKKLDNARHCTLFEAVGPQNNTAFSSQNYRDIWNLKEADCELQIVSYPGVFAHGHLDAGSSLLIDTLAKLPISGSVLDFGCGAGVIGACIKSAYPATCVSFLDTSALAIRACEETLRTNGLEGTVLASNGLAETPRRYHWVVSNPPIHSGVKTDNHLSMKLLDPVLQYLEPGGQLLLVANRHLPYEKWMRERFGGVKEINANAHFKVLLAG